MELSTEILAHYLSQQDIQIIFPNLQLDAKEIVQLQCYQALREIKAVIQDDTLTDRECFNQIEEIICVFEQIGSTGGNRHDFG